MDYIGFSKISAMRKGQNVILFLNPDNYEFFGKYGEPGYRINGSDGGKMVLKDGLYQAIISSDFKSIVKDESCDKDKIDNLMNYAESKDRQ